jgi:hypothetical protein
MPTPNPVSVLVELAKRVGRTYVDSRGWIRCLQCRAIVKQAGRLEVCETPCLGWLARDALTTREQRAPTGPAREAVERFWEINLDEGVHDLDARDVVVFLEARDAALGERKTT